MIHDNNQPFKAKLKYDMTLPDNFYQEQAELKLPNLNLNMRPPQI